MANRSIGSAFLIYVSLSRSTPVLPITQNSELNVCLILHNYAKGEMTCSAVIEAYYKYMLCYQWS